MQATLGFLVNLPMYQNVQPYQILGFHEHDGKTNCVYHDKELSVQDARNKIDDFNLYKHGFQFVKHKSRFSLEAEHFETLHGQNTSVVFDYVEETMDLVKKLLSASKTVCFDWRV